MTLMMFNFRYKSISIKTIMVDKKKCNKIYTTKFIYSTSLKTTINVILFYDKKHITISIITPSPSPVKKNENKHSQTKRPCTLIDSESLNEKHFHGGSGIPLLDDPENFRPQI